MSKLKSDNAVMKDNDSFFSVREKTSLLILAFGLLTPMFIPGIRYRLPEMAMVFFLLATGNLRVMVLKIFPFLILLYIPLVVELLIPAAFFPLKRNLLICSKLTIFALFTFSLLYRCKVEINALWLGKRILLPLSCILSISFLIDQTTKNTFFSTWHNFFSTKSDAFFENFLDLLAMDSLVGNGFLTRNSDIFPWCIIGITTTAWLYNANLMKTYKLLFLISLFLITIFFIPKRSAFLVLAISSAVLMLFGGLKMKKSISITLFVMLLLSFIGSQYLLNELLESGIIRNVHVAGGFNRFMDAPLGGGQNREYDDRIVLGLAQIDYLLGNPRHLLFGAGWDFASSIWIKPHSTVLALLMGGGIFGVMTIILGLSKIFIYYREICRNHLYNRIYLFSLIALILYNIIDSAFFLGIEYPGSLFVTWMIWTIILYGIPTPLSKTKPIHD